MPSAQLIFRAVCGQFAFIFNSFMSKRASLKAAMKTATCKLRTRIDGINAGLLLALFFYGNLLPLCGDIELNPGPPKMNSTRQTRLTSCGKSRRYNNDNTPPEVSTSAQSTSSEPTLKDIMELLCSINNSWSQPFESGKTMDEAQTTAEATMSDAAVTEETTSVDFTSILDSLNRKFNEMQHDLLQLTNMCKKVQSEVTNLKEEMTDIKNEHAEVKKTNCVLLDRIDALEKKADALEFKSKRNNLLLHGIGRKENESNDECKQAVNKLLTDHLDASESFQFDRLYRLNSKPDSPILASVTSFRQKQMILQGRHKFQECQVFVTEDFPIRIREIRRKLVPFLKEARKMNKKAYLVYDHLMIDGKKFCLNQNNLKEKE